MEAVLNDTPGVTVDYAAVVDPLTLEPLTQITGAARGLIAARLGTVRLIDNMSLTD
jgi:pantoate--beta-alanine ligase